MIMAVRPVMPAGEQVEAAKTGVMLRAASVKRTGIVMANTFLMKPRLWAPDLSLLPSSIDTIIHLWITLRYSRVSRLGNWILRSLALAGEGVTGNHGHGQDGKEATGWGKMQFTSPK